ncbi:MAG: transcriptional regulator [bacterium]|nr:transcriptional regulator [bacterium]
MSSTIELFPTRALVLGMIRNDGKLLVSELNPVAEACGITSERLRSCLRRLVAKGILSRSGSGRWTHFALTELGLEKLQKGRNRIKLAYLQDRGERPWDGNWHLVGFAIPESRRTLRDSFRTRLRKLGGAPIQGGLYVCAHPWEPDVMAEAKRLEVAGYISLMSTRDLEIAGTRDPETIAEMLWSLRDLAQRYHELNQRYSEMVPRLKNMRDYNMALSDGRFVQHTLRMGVDFSRIFDPDPLLPLELLPAPWPGTLARTLIRQGRALALQIRQQQKGALLFSDFDETIGGMER